MDGGGCRRRYVHRRWRCNVDSGRCRRWCNVLHRWRWRRVAHHRWWRGMDLHLRGWCGMHHWWRRLNRGRLRGRRRRHMRCRRLMRSRKGRICHAARVDRRGNWRITSRRDSGGASVDRRRPGMPRSLRSLHYWRLRGCSRRSVRLRSAADAWSSGQDLPARADWSRAGPAPCRPVQHGSRPAADAWLLEQDLPRRPDWSRSAPAQCRPARRAFRPVADE